ncbi:MAG: LCP family protein [Chloroflexi bacterium]|nr:LCP family protein [Chloroflexota bacterium]
MKAQRIVLLNLVLVLVLTVSGCTRSRAGAASGVEASADAAGVSVADASIRLAAVAPTPTVAPAPTDALPDQTGLAVKPHFVELPGAQEAQIAETPIEPPLSRTVNVLVLGADRRPHEGHWRTDVLMLIALDMAGRQAAAISLPRDIYMDEIPGHRPNKINVIDFLGEQDEPGSGPDLLASILEEKIGVPIHHFLRFDFEGFKKVVDALGGVEIDVECRVYEYLPEEDINLYLVPGTHRLAGKMALGYVRARNQGGDLERARRQQRMVWAVRNQLLNENQLPNLPALYAALRDSVQTDIGFVDAIRLARFALNLAEDDIHGMVISPPDLVKSGWRGGMSVFIADWPLVAERMQTLFERPPLFQTNTVGAEGDRVQCP